MRMLHPDLTAGPAASEIFRLRQAIANARHMGHLQLHDAYLLASLKVNSPFIAPSFPTPSCSPRLMHQQDKPIANNEE